MLRFGLFEAPLRPARKTEGLLGNQPMVHSKGADIIRIYLGMPAEVDDIGLIASLFTRLSRVFYLFKQKPNTADSAIDAIDSTVETAICCIVRRQVM